MTNSIGKSCTPTAALRIEVAVDEQEKTVSELTSIVVDMEKTIDKIYGPQPSGQDSESKQPCLSILTKLDVNTQRIRDLSERIRIMLGRL